MYIFINKYLIIFETESMYNINFMYYLNLIETIIQKKKVRFFILIGSFFSP